MLQRAGPSPLKAAPDLLLTVTEIATELRVSRATVYRLVDSGILPHFRVSNAIRVRRRDLDDFIAGRGGER